MEEEKNFKKNLVFVLIIAIVVLLLFNSFKTVSKQDGVSTMVTRGDVNPPSVLIENPQQMNDEGLFFLRGTASDDRGVKVVKIKVNNGIWEDALGTDSWNKNLNLVKGANIVYVQVVDVSGNISPVSSKEVYY